MDQTKQNDVQELKTRGHLDERQVTIIMLLAQVCSLYDHTPKTFVVNVLRFYELGLINSLTFLQDLGLVPDAPQDLLSIDTTRINGIVDFSSNESLNISRYDREFIELQPIGYGAFGRVFMARHKLDGHLYAIKKVCFRNKGYQDADVQRVLREVKCLARCDHPNVNRYYGAWLEPSWVPKSSRVSTKGVAEPPNVSAVERRRLLHDIHQMVNPPPSVSPRTRMNNHITECFDVPNRDLLNAVVPVARQETHRLTINSSTLYRRIATCENSTVVEETSATSSLDISNIDTGMNALDLGYEFSASSTGFSIESIGKSDGIQMAPATTSIQPHFGYEIKLYIQMYLCEQKTLREWLDDRTTKRLPIDSEKNIDIFKQIVAGVAHVHTNDIIHRDLKPNNVFLGRDGYWKVGDFGLSKLLDGCMHGGDETDATASRDVDHHDHTSGIGTAAYASPEQANGSIYDEKADSYSLGVILLEMFYSFSTGMERAHVLQDLRRDPPLVPQHLRSKHPVVAAMIEKLVDSQPENRPSARELLDHELFRYPGTFELQERVKEQESIIAALREEIAKLKEKA